MQRALKTARHDFTSELDLDKLRADGKLAQERLKAAKTRALSEIGRERQVAGRLQKELDTANGKTEQGNVQHRDHEQKLQAQVGNLRQQVGVLEGKLDAPRTENARYADEAVQARDQRDQHALSLTDAAAKQKVLTASGQRNLQEPRARAVARWVNRRGHAKPDLVGVDSARTTHDSALEHHARGISR